MDAKKRKLSNQNASKDDDDGSNGDNVPIRTLYVAPIKVDVSNFLSDIFGILLYVSKTFHNMESTHNTHI